jgi:hypothetical protein
MRLLRFLSNPHLSPIDFATILAGAALFSWGGWWMLAGAAVAFVGGVVSAAIRDLTAEESE